MPSLWLPLIIFVDRLGSLLETIWCLASPYLLFPRRTFSFLSSFLFPCLSYVMNGLTCWGCRCLDWVITLFL
ncbi:hypothetical protein BGX38DRAFT_782205 [Terfezia claveryi]|nr:hypothetical protein BGX38DRAFT_782205 [Terfezia claveryi]